MSVLTVHDAPAPLPKRPTTNRPTEGIGSETDNRAFLAFLVSHGDSAMIARGCCLCREVGHRFDTGCLL